MAFPQTTAPTLNNWQAQFNGLTIGAGTPYDLNGIEGLDLPAIRSGDTSRPRSHGEWMGLDLLAGREITIVGDFVSDGTSLQHAAEALGTAFAPGALTELPFWIQMPNLPILGMMVRTRKRNVPVDLGYSVSALAQMTIQLHATDPRLYAAAQSSSCVTALSPATTDLTVNNAGNYETRPLLTLAGPLHGPTVFQSSAGPGFWFIQLINPAGGIDIASGDTVVIDTDTHAVTYYVGGTGNGTPIKNWVQPGNLWPNTAIGTPGMIPGNNVFTFNSTSGSDTGTLTVTWASAYLI
jgi:hypothetical protein